MFLSSLSRHNKELEQWTLKPSARHSSHREKTCTLKTVKHRRFVTDYIAFPAAPPIKCKHWSPTLNVTISGDRTLIEAIKVKWSHKGWAQCKRTGVLIRKETQTPEFVSLFTSTEGRAYEATARRRLPPHQEERSH